MRWCTPLIRSIDAFTEQCGRLLAWLLAAMALLTGTVVMLRYGFNIGSVAAQEAVTYLHACAFMLGAAYALKSDAHVRVDIFYRKLTPRGRAWVNSVGGITLLLPFCALLFFGSLHFSAQAWAIGETSADAGGIPAIFLLKSLLPLMALNLGAQGVAEILRNALFLYNGTWLGSTPPGGEDNTVEATL